MSRSLRILKDQQDEALVFHSSQECGDILDANTRDRNDGPKDQQILGRKIASVPLTVLDAWKAEGIDYMKIAHDIEQRKAFYRKLREYKKFLTYDGGIGK